MSDETAYPSLPDIRARNIPRLTADTAGFSITPNEGAVDGPERAAEAMSQIDTYLRAFCHTEGNKCPRCDNQLGAKDFGDALSTFFGVRKGGFEWGMCHGEGHCKECLWPCRAYHRKVGPIDFFQAVYAYHPDDVLTDEERKAPRAIRRARARPRAGARPMLTIPAQLRAARARAEKAINDERGDILALALMRLMADSSRPGNRRKRGHLSARHRTGTRGARMHRRGEGVR